MFKRLLAFVFGGVRERIKAEESYEREFGVPPMRGMTTRHIKRRVEQHKSQPMAILRRRAPDRLVQDDPLLNPIHPASPINPAYHQPVTRSRSHDTCEDSNSRHHGGHDSHHSSSSYDSGSSDGGSSSNCD